MNLFRVRGIMLAVHFSFFLLLAVHAFTGWADGGTVGAFTYAGVLLACFTCVVLHEFGHCFTAMHFGINIRRILLLPIGGMAEFETIPREPRRELLITLAGPAVNFAIAAVLWTLLWATGATETSDAAASDTAVTAADFGFILMQWNLAMGCFNLLPAFPMDGGRILRALLATRFDYLRATFWAASIGKGLCVTAIATVLFFISTDTITAANGGLMCGLFAFIFLVGEMEYRATRRRAVEEEQIRLTYERYYAAPLLAVLPPENKNPSLATGEIGGP